MPQVAAYPLKLCIGSIVTTSLGLATAALNLQWSRRAEGGCTGILVALCASDADVYVAGAVAGSRVPKNKYG